MSNSEISDKEKKRILTREYQRSKEAKEKRKIYIEKNKEKIRQQKQEYFQKNKERLKLQRKNRNILIKEIIELMNKKEL